MFVVDYDPSWPLAFASLKARLRRAVFSVATAIEHVGSTSVHGLAAKPVLDIDVVVARSDVVKGIERLKTLGYEHQGDLGVPLREAFRRPAGTVRHNLYLCPVDSPALANHVALRDYLRAHLEVARAYGDLKRRLAVEHAGDIDAYVEGKTAFIVTILSKVGFSAAALSDIEAIHRRRREHES